MTRKVKPEPNAGLASRMFTAQAESETRLGRRWTLEEIGAEVARRTGREEPQAPSVVRRWLRGLSEPSLATLTALADLFGVDPGWLAFGRAEPAPTAVVDPGPSPGTRTVQPFAWQPAPRPEAPPATRRRRA